MTRRRRQSLVAVVAGALVASTAAVGINLTGAPAPVPAVSEEGDVPTALSAHLEQLRQSIPGMDESREGPWSAAEEEFQARAYPADTISVAKIEGAREAYRKLVASGPPNSVRVAIAEGGTAADASSWRLFGPSKAVYPDTKFRSVENYVPNRYVAGGRTTDIAMAETCEPGNCRIYITASGGGVWRTDDALAKNPDWEYLAGPFGINAAGSVTIDPNDPTGRTIYVGTGEANICGSGCVAGVGIYRSTNGGKTWQGPIAKEILGAKGIGEIIIKPGNPKVIYAATTTALRGFSSVCCAGVTRPVPGAEEWGLYKSRDGGETWRMIHNGTARERKCTGSTDQFLNLEACSPRGVRHIKLDPADPNTIYAGSYARGIWRSTDQGRHWKQIKESLNPAIIQTRPAFDVTTLPNGDTRMYVHEGNFFDPYSRLFRSDDVATGNPKFKDLTSANPADPGYATYNQCGFQCWYDIFVYTPPGHPNIVYTGGSYGYDETNSISNGRGVVLSTNAGRSGTDMTFDATDPVHPNGLHPDQHAIVTNPNNPFQFFEVNDGGIMRSNGKFADVSSWCDDRTFDDLNEDGSTAEEQARCEQLLSRVPQRLRGINNGLSTLQFITLSVSPHDPEGDLVQGGTQDNGTWDTNGNRVKWTNIMIGDGGWSGFDAKNENFRFHNFFNVTPEVNFEDGDIGKWIWTADPLFLQPDNQFYAPVISDPKVSGTMFAGTGHSVFRTKTFGLGKRTYFQAQRNCNTFFGAFNQAKAPCGDWKSIGQPLADDDDEPFDDLDGEAVVAVERTEADRNTAWAATNFGKVFITRNAQAKPNNVVWNRIDDDSQMAPGRFVSSIDVDGTNPQRAWVSYSGYSRSTPDTPGHVFRVDVAGGVATWKNLTDNRGDIPVNDLVHDEATGDLYAASDFGVQSRIRGTRTWAVAGPELPNVAVAGLTILPEKRILYAATHGRSAWRLDLRR